MPYDYLRPPEPTLQFPQVGTVTNVWAVDNPNNKTDGLLTYYTVVAGETQNTLCPATFAAVPAMGLTGGLSEESTPYHVGDKVVLVWLGGHPERPFILGRYIAPLESDADMTTDTYPRHYVRRNNLVEIVDKEGTKKETLVEGQSTEIYGANGKLRYKLTDGGDGEIHDAQGRIQARYKADGSREEYNTSGGLVGKRFADGSREEYDNGGAVTQRWDQNGQVDIGGTGGKRLLTEDFVVALAQEILTAVHDTGDGGLAFKTNLAAALDAALVTANSTASTKAK